MRIIPLLWVTLSIIPALIASRRGWTGPVWFFVSLLISPLLAGILVALLPNRRDPEMYCPACGTVGRPKTLTRGSFAIQDSSTPHGALRRVTRPVPLVCNQVSSLPPRRAPSRLKGRYAIPRNDRLRCPFLEITQARMRLMQ